ncbi:MAG: TMEM175 family protein [Actinomycetota bacterium]
MAEGSSRILRRPRYGRGESEFDRALTFIDATFALALTLLVTTLDVGGERSIWESVGALGRGVGSQFMAFALSFAVIALYWLANHRILASFAALDTPVIVTNLLLIASVVLIPFTTEALGDAPGNLPLPTVAYAVNIAATSVLHQLVYAVGYRRGLLADPPRRGAFARSLVAGLTPAAVFLASIPVAFFVSPDAAQLSWIALALLGPVASRWARRGGGARASGPTPTGGAEGR